jgi:hypothetical protein
VLHTFPAFATLVEFAEEEIVEVGHINGWSVDRWLMSDGALQALADLYHSVITGGIEPEIENALAVAGVDVTALFYDENDSEARHRTTRADLCEFAAAAAWVAIETWPAETLHLANFPKASRNKSETGVDVFSLLMDDAAPIDELSDGDALFVGSVKHTVTSPADLRYKLVRSVSADLEMTPAYLLSQLRVFVGRLAERGITAQRAFLFLGEEFESSARVAIGMAGGVDATSEQSSIDQLADLPVMSVEDRTCRLLLIPSIADLHQAVALDG